MPVYRNSAFENDLFTTTSGSKSGFGKEFLETKHGKQTRKPKAEIRKKTEGRNPNGPQPSTSLFGIGTSGFFRALGIRTSGFTSGILFGFAQAGDPVASL